MAEIKNFPVVRHLRAEPTARVLHYRRGALVRDSAGLAFWFRPIHTAVAEVPIDDRELPFLFRVRSADFQELVVQGVITFRVAAPAALARASTSRSTSRRAAGRRRRSSRWPGADRDPGRAAARGPARAGAAGAGRGARDGR